MSNVTLIEGDTATTPAQGTTWGSLTVQLGGMQLRNAAATAKAALLEEAAKTPLRQTGGPESRQRRGLAPAASA